MNKVFKYILLLVLSNVTFAQLGGNPGAFTRMGFSARGISMGNAMTSVIQGDVTGFYNPAISAFQNKHLINLSYSFLSFDRKLNFISYTKNFKFPNQKSGGAGVTFSWINAGVSDIDGRDIDGFHTENYSVYENQFMFAPAIQVSEKFAFGIGFKLYYSKLFEGVKSTSIGFDVGALYMLNEKITLGLSVKDINSKYEWNTNDIYGQYGNTTKDKFPLLYTLGVSYNLPMNFGLVSLDFQSSNKKSNIIRMGIEVRPVKDFAFRGGFDRFDFNSSDKFGNSSFMFGLGYQKELKLMIVGIDYAFVMEPYSNRPFQNITAVFKFK